LNIPENISFFLNLGKIRNKYDDGFVFNLDEVLAVKFNKSKQQKTILLYFEEYNYIYYNKIIFW
jgi:hypothetical protein